MFGGGGRIGGGLPPMGGGGDEESSTTGSGTTSPEARLGSRGISASDVDDLFLMESSSGPPTSTSSTSAFPSAYSSAGAAAATSPRSAPRSAAAVAAAAGSSPAMDAAAAAATAAVAAAAASSIRAAEGLADAFRPVVEYLRSAPCYEMMPASGKILVVHTDTSVRAAFAALVEHNMKSASLWDGKRLVGMLDVTDYIQIVLHHHLSATPRGLPAGAAAGAASDDAILRDLSRSVASWKATIAPTAPLGPDAYPRCAPDDNLLDVMTAILRQRQRRMPVVDPETGNVVHLITHSRVLRFALQQIADLDDPVYERSMIDLGVGTYENITMAFAETPFIHLLDLVDRRRLSAVPIVDERGMLVAKFVKSDIKAVASHRTFRSLNRPIREVFLEVVGRQIVYTYRKSSSLREVLELFCSTRVYTLVCVDADGAVNGVVTLSDIFRLFVPNAVVQDDDDDH